VTDFSSSRDDLVASLRAYTSHLAAQNEALQQVSVTTAQMRSKLTKEENPDISDALLQRDSEIARFEALRDSADQTELLNAALAASNTTSEELNSIARSVIALREDSRALAEDILACQSECEMLLKQRLDATSDAIHRSRRRRKLDAAYGPAISHDVPTFMDKQQ
jgi:hypothetical protein